MMKKIRTWNRGMLCVGVVVMLLEAYVFTGAGWLAPIAYFLIGWPITYIIWTYRG